jgi:hypothetical protein
MVRMYFGRSKDSLLCRTRVYYQKYENTEGYVEGQSSLRSKYSISWTRIMRTNSSGVVGIGW